ncbi:kinase-like protein [Hygrophoropsis aurantiaca]|uniref:Kinase-like protein n=1 Tax=Hygrophoropsis aurantiaca TaxID=72124 RepID=A0ACB8AA69_9AGAM|nr:kinase-like protein [Hygrophoropsis aurantiaca]
MLQYSAQPIPLSLAYSKNQPARKDKDIDIRHNDTLPPVQQTPSSRLFPRFTKDVRPARPSGPVLTQSSVQHHVNHPSQHSSPIPVHANLSPSSSQSPLPSPLPRSSFISTHPSSSPLSIPSPLPSNSPLPGSASRTRRVSATNSTRPSTARRSSYASSLVEDVLAPGDLVGEDILLQGQLIRPATSPSAVSTDDPELAKEFEVIRRLGTGSYAVVYLVREVLSRSIPSDDGHIGVLDFDGPPKSKSYTTYGRDFALKCLSKANLDEEALAAQMSEVTIHQSLRAHPNIVTLHRTLETSSFLLLLLEFVPGEDLFYFLEQARDHYEAPATLDMEIGSPSRTPPTPGLLASMHPAQLLSSTRLRLVASMFGQMCDAVAACHEQHVYHRDIKPENFIVTDGWVNHEDGRRERKVVVKLTDFGLSTTEDESSDMDCGSAPYMSFECRNNVAPTYSPAAADVWSLGIVLINMLYHYNPWTDTAEGACSSFSLFRQHGSAFFMQRFTGMTPAVAEFLASRVFCIPSPDSVTRYNVSSREFGTWVKDLPSLLGDRETHPRPGHKRVVSTSSTVGHPLSSCAPSRRPSSRAGTHGATLRTPIIHSRSLSRAPSFGPAFEAADLSTVFDSELLEEPEPEAEAEMMEEAERDLDDGRSRSTKKRGKRGARKGKGVAHANAVDDTLETLAVASQSLAREISMVSRSSSHARPIDISRGASRSPSRARGLSAADGITTEARAVSTVEVSPVAPAPAPPVAAPVGIVKKASKWKLGFGKNSAPPPVEDPAPGTASNVTNLLMGLSPMPQQQSTPPVVLPPVTRQRSPADEASTWTRGRRLQNTPYNNQTWGPSSGVPGTSPHASVERNPRGLSPTSTRSGRAPLASSASSVMSSANSNWRSSMSTTSSASTSTSAFTRYSNSSMRSVSTTATSVSSSSWRAQSKPVGPQGKLKGEPIREIPKNVKIMSGVPWELYELPRQLHPNPVGDIFGAPPVRKPRTRKPKDSKLDTISERPGAPQKPPVHQRRDAATSTTELDGFGDGESDGAPKKVQKSQINALAKMLSALRR